MNVAILIDAENVLPSHADAIFSHAASLGNVVHKEIYGAAQALTSWVAPVLKYAIHSNLTIRASKGKNSSDIALVIGAMDMLLAGGVDAVVIASSDSDFSALSVRLRNAGVEVVGMGTDKANELWRTACSSFVVLQNPKPQAAAKASQQPARTAQQPAKSAQPQAEDAPRLSRSAKAAGLTHEERVGVIRALIEKRLKGHGGRVQVSTLFPALNQLAEYRVDKQGSGKKPMNYLLSTFADAFHFEEASDGQNWVSIQEDGAPAAPAEAQAPAEEPEAAASEAAPETPEEAPAAAAPAEAPAEAQAPEAAGSEGDEPDPFALLLAAGLPEDVAGQIVVIFTESEDLRTAYNRLRTTFGNTAGREYYQLVKEIAAQREA